MAEGSFCDYAGQMDSNLMSHLAGYGARTGSENLGDGSQSKGGLGFYMEHVPTGMPVTSMEALGLSNMAAGNQANHDALLAASMMSQAAAAGMFENVMNYAMKQEKGLPPTPPGSPDDPKEVQQVASQQGYHGNMHPASMVAMQSSMNPNLLAKPVPMRRLSEKRIAQARASLSSAATTEQTLPHALIGGSEHSSVNSSPALARALVAVQQTQKRPRSEKKAIPDEQKDDKYFERRKRNNNAAKKSRDARKSREDEIAIRASFLEKENAILRAQVTTLREEANSLRQLLLQKRSTRH